MQPEDFLEKTGVSHETFATIRLYNELLVKWQKAINLVSNKTLNEAWLRHFYDSAQLLKYIPDDVKIIADFGSGAGFPSLVLALMRSDLEVHLIESDERKCQFLKTVSRETERIVFVHPERIEAVLPRLEPDLVMARAFASLSKILEISEVSWRQNVDLKMLLLKGRSADEEILEAREVYSFDVESYPSETDSEAQILLIQNISSV